MNDDPNDDPCDALESLLQSELGERRDWWLLASGTVHCCVVHGAIARWVFPQGIYEVWLAYDESWRIKLPDGHIIVAQRWLLQSTLWRAILSYPTQKQVDNGL